MHDYSPPQLRGKTPAQAAVLAQPYRRLSAGERLAIPGVLPITAGRIHFTRSGPVRADGTVPILNEAWPVGKCWAGQYVWATVSTDRHTLLIYHRPLSPSPCGASGTTPTHWLNGSCPSRRKFDPNDTAANCLRCYEPLPSYSRPLFCLRCLEP